MSEMSPENRVRELIAESDDSFLQKKDAKYQGGLTLEEAVAKHGIKTRPLTLPRPDSLDD